MRSVLWAAAFVAGFSAVAHAQSPTQHVNSVGQIDRQSKTFQTWKGTTTTFKVTDRTVFQAGGTPTSWTALKAGHDVTVTYHPEGKNSVADAVVISNW